ncbi:MAG: hypothetical protein IPP44_08880 [Ideonella sp.]|nr:hypothetical protein [Ideonella sp.]
MSSNVISFLDRKRARTVDSGNTLKSELATQLELQFDGSSVVLFAFAGDFAFPDDFLNFCNATMPDVLVDMRVAPRLDFVRPVRSQAFELFGSFGIEYRDILGRLGAITYDMPQTSFEQVMSNFESLRAVHNDLRPMMALFDNVIFAQNCAAKLSQAFQVVMLDTEAVRRSAIEGARLRM